MNLLHIDSSIAGDASTSRKLTAETVAAWLQSHPETQVQYLDVAATPPGHLSAAGFPFGPAPDGASAAVQADRALSEALVAQFLAANVVVIGAPLYNFSIPSQLKAWIDRVVQAGRTFGYSPQGPVGTAGGKTVFVVSTRGGQYATSDAGRAMEHQESYLQAVFKFLGIDDVRIVRAEGLKMGPGVQAEALAEARQAIAHAAAPAPVAV